MGKKKGTPYRYAIFNNRGEFISFEDSILHKEQAIEHENWLRQIKMIGKGWRVSLARIVEDRENG